MDPKATRRLGRTAVELPQFGLGGVPFGGLLRPANDALATATVAAAWDAGVRYFDTAPWYGLGQSEHRMGRSLYFRPRNEFVISTKVGRILRAPSKSGSPPSGNWVGALPFEAIFDYSYDGVMRSYEDSLQRLGLNCIDILIVHDLDVLHHRTEAGVTAQLTALCTSGHRALKELKTSGRVRAIGAGINTLGMIPRFLDVCDPDFFLVAMPYTLLEQDVLDAEFPLCQALGIGIIIGSVFSSGILATGAVPGATHAYSNPSPDIVQKVQRIEAVCARYNVVLKSAAMQFPLLHPLVASVIPGALGPDQVLDNINAFSRTIPDDLWAELKYEGLIRNDAPTQYPGVPQEAAASALPRQANLH
jgi:D-threo-aldose 1-dehydrogenase